MKTKLFIFVLFILAFSQPLLAQENEKTDFSLSIGFLFNYAQELNIGNIDGEDFSGEFGFNLNIMFFKNSNFGYYINIYGLHYGGSNSEFGEGQFYIGFIPGIGYKKEINNYLSFFTGIGPELRYSLIQFFPDNTAGISNINQFGFGIGGVLEARLKIYNKFSFAGGVLISSNFFSGSHRNLNFYPYIGFSWN